MNLTLQNSTEGPTGSEWLWLCDVIPAQGVIGVLGNLLVCFVTLRVKFLHSMTNYLLVNLAVADMLLCLDEFFYYIMSSGCTLLILYPTSIGGTELYCRLIYSRFLSWAFAFASSYSLCVVTLQRYVAIVNPLHYEIKLTATRMKSLIALIWVLSFLSSLPHIFLVESIVEPDDTCAYHHHQEFEVLLTAFKFLLGYLLPIMLMSSLYYKIQATLKRQAKALNMQQARAAAYDLVIARQRLVRTLVIVLGALIVLWTPSFISILLCDAPTNEQLISFCDSDIYYYGSEVCDFLFYLNSVINPIIYELKYKKFQQGVKVAACGCIRRKSKNRVDVELVAIQMHATL